MANSSTCGRKRAFDELPRRLPLRDPAERLAREMQKAAEERPLSGSGKDPMLCGSRSFTGLPYHCRSPQIKIVCQQIRGHSVHNSGRHCGRARMRAMSSGARCPAHAVPGCQSQIVPSTWRAASAPALCRQIKQTEREPAGDALGPVGAACDSMYARVGCHAGDGKRLR